MRSRLKTAAITLLAVLFAPALLALDMQNTPIRSTADPGTINYVEGTASLNGHPVTQSSIKSQMATLKAGQVLSTTNSRAEVLLTPGVFLRLGHNSSVKMITPDLINTAVAVTRGRAEVEVDVLHQANDIHVLLNSTPVQIVATGLYEFDAENDTVMVFDGKVAALKPDHKWATAGKGHELQVAQNGVQNVTSFNETAQEQTPLYKWSSLRSSYMAEANRQMADVYPYSYGPGWYWDPYALDYTFLGPYGFYSPFGWGFYPLGWGMGWGGWYGPGYYGYGGGLGGWFVPRRAPMQRPIPLPGHSGATSGMRPGFHPGGGGFHGGGGGGGRPIAMPSGGSGGGGGGGRPR